VKGEKEYAYQSLTREEEEHEVLEAQVERGVGGEEGDELVQEEGAWFSCWGCVGWGEWCVCVCVCLFWWRKGMMSLLRRKGPEMLGLCCGVFSRVGGTEDIK
jgi:hypothetical protein